MHHNQVSYLQKAGPRSLYPEDAWSKSHCLSIAVLSEEAMARKDSYLNPGPLALLCCMNSDIWQICAEQI